MTNEEIVSEIQQGHDERHNLEQLFNRCKGLIIKTIVPYTRKGLEFDDLFQESFIATVNAAKCFKDEGSAKFSTFLCECVKNRCKNYRWKQYPVHVSGYILTNVREYIRLMAEHQEGELTDEMIESELNVNSDELFIIRQVVSSSNVESLQQTIPSDEGNMTLEDTIPDTHSIDGLFEDEECDPSFEGKLDAILSLELTDKEKQAVEEYFFKGGSVSRYRDFGTNAKNNALKRLRKSYRLKELYDGYSDYGSMSFNVSRNYLLNHSTSTTEMIAIKRVEQEEKRLNMEHDIELDFRKLKEDMNRLNDLINGTLSERKKEILIRRYGQRLLQNEIAEIDGVSRQSVFCVERSALKALGKNKEIMSLADEMLELLTKYGVSAYDSDMIKVRNLLMKVVDSNE